MGNKNFVRGLVDQHEGRTLYSVKDDRGKQVCYHLQIGTRTVVIHYPLSIAREILGKPLPKPNGELRSATAQVSLLQPANGRRLKIEESLMIENFLELVVFSVVRFLGPRLTVVLLAIAAFYLWARYG